MEWKLSLIITMAERIIAVTLWKKPLKMTLALALKLVGPLNTFRKRSNLTSNFKQFPQKKVLFDEFEGNFIKTDNRTPIACVECEWMKPKREVHVSKKINPPTNEPIFVFHCRTKWNDNRRATRNWNQRWRRRPTWNWKITCRRMASWISPFLI